MTYRFNQSCLALRGVLCRLRMDWFYVDDKREQNGPHKVAAMKTLFADKVIDGDTLCWAENQDNWAPIDTVPELKQALLPPPPLPPAETKPPPPPPAAATAELNKKMGQAAIAPIAKVTQKNERMKRTVSVNGWGEVFTPDGVPYYLNEVNGALSWDKPEELATEEDKDESGESWVFVNDEAEGYVPIRILSEKSGTIHGVNFIGQSVQYASSKVAEKITAKSILLNLQDDLVHMKEVNEATITHCLRERFLKDKIYTSIGDIIVSINPWKGLPLYTPEIIDKYAHHDGERLPPHVFDTARRSYAQIVDHKAKVSVLISGESGAGKTEATKQILTYLSEVAGGTSNISAKLLSANPVLEAFGNAKTLRNNNSSRFGKYMQVYFDNHSRIESCDIKNYLLEGSRLVRQSPGERTFHIFYQMCAGLSADRKRELALVDASAYRYLNGSGCITIPGMDDKEEYEDVQAALNNLGFSAAEQANLQNITAAVLHIGNVSFDVKEGESGQVSSLESDSVNIINTIAGLIGVDAGKLKKVLITREITLRGETMSVELTKEKAEHGRDAFAKKLYGFMFNWIVMNINRLMAPKNGVTHDGPEDQTAYVGILDIFGFEIFKFNSFEQLCINFCNEKLQQHFNTHTFKSEEELYRLQGIPFEHIEYKDNQDVLDLIEKKPSGILVMLDDEVSVPRGSDIGFHGKLIKRQKNHGRFSYDKKAKNLFSIDHYAGKVEYTVDNFCEKNKDRLEEDVAIMLTQSTNPLVQLLMDDTRQLLEAKAKGLTTTRATRYRTRTQGGQFRLSLNSLMTALNSTRPYYVRCVKSNDLKQPGVFDGSMCLEQLRYSGVFEAVAIRMQGYPFRYSHEEFFKRFRCLCKTPLAVESGAWSTGCHTIVDELSGVDRDLKHCHVGTSMVLYRSKQNAILELRRVNIVRVKVLTLQRSFRGYRGRNLVRMIMEHVPKLEAAIETRDKDALQKAIEDASGLWFEPKAYSDAVFILGNLEKEAQIRQQLTQLESMDPEEHYDEFSETLKKVEDIRVHDTGAFSDNLSTRVLEKFESVKERREVIKGLKRAAEDVDKENLSSFLGRCDKLKVKWGDNFCSAEETAAREALERVKQEESYAREIQKAILVPTITGTAGSIITEPQNTLRLQSALTTLEHYTAHCPLALEALRTGNMILALRTSFLSALNSNEPASGEKWSLVMNAVADADACFNGTGEIPLVKEEVALRNKIDDVAKRLTDVIAARDENGLLLCLEQGLALGFSTHQNQAYRDMYYDGKKLVGDLQEMRELLEVGMKRMLVSKLKKGLAQAKTLQCSNAVTQKAQLLLEEIERTMTFGDNAIDAANIVELKVFLERCERQKINLPDRQKRAKEILALPESKLLQLQLKCSLRREDMERVTQITLRIKELFFKDHGGSFVFSRFTKLKKPSQFAKRFGVTQDYLRKNMLKWTDEPIHTSLTRLPDAETKRLATRYFKNVLGYMGDRAYSYPLVLGHEVIEAGIANPELRDEIYCQIIKQMIDNPSSASIRRGWNLMALALSSFPPSDELENFLEMFLRKNDQLRSVKKLHKIVFGGAMPEAISIDHMDKVQTKGHRFSIVQRGSDHGRAARFSVILE